MFEQYAFVGTSTVRNSMLCVQNEVVDEQVFGQGKEIMKLERNLINVN